MNWLIRLLTYFTPPIEGDPNEWLERDYPLGGILWRDFKCGSCRGIYRSTTYRTFSKIGIELEILAVQNTKKNDHFNKVMEWFEKSCKRQHLRLSFLDIENPKLLKKLSNLGFTGNKTKMSKDF